MKLSFATSAHAAWRAFYLYSNGHKSIMPVYRLQQRFWASLDGRRYGR